MMVVSGYISISIVIYLVNECFDMNECFEVNFDRAGEYD
jgi:hypothetical protein